ncbi:autotransporter-associated beta strand repeat-containing protein [Parelusimicrobium proximum]|uniref:autotransporter outer membrane beta-barrel domain-containing protein n=1 Tax=Parelusimicrobium proximum TaxID=3228953 RepID=UPI003D18417D
MKTLLNVFLMIFCLQGFVYGVCIDDGFGNITCDTPLSSDIHTDASSSSADTLAKTGAGEQVLTGNNTINNSVDINGGTLTIGSESALSGGYILNITNATFNISGGEVELSNDVNVAASSVINTSAEDDSLTLTGTLSGAALRKTGEGALILGGSSAFTGALDISGGAVIAGSDSLNGNISSAADTAVIFDQDTDGAYTASANGAGSMIKTGSGQLELSGSNTLTDFIIEEGEIKISASSNLNGNLTLDGGALRTDGDISLGGAGTEIIVDNSDHGFITDGGTLTIADGTQIFGSGGVVKDGSGTLVLDTTGASYLGDTKIYGGVLSIKDGASLGDSASSVILDGGSLYVSDNTSVNRAVQVNNTAGSVDIASGKTVGISGPVTGAGKLIKDGSGTLVLGGAASHTGGTDINAGILQATSETLSGAVNNDASLVFDQGADGTFIGSISGTGDIDKKGAGTLTLSGNNTFTGNINIEEGSLRGDSLSLSSDVITSSDTTLIFGQSFNDSYSHSVSGAGGVRKEGAGVLELSGVNTYSGGTFITGDGALMISADTALGAAGSSVMLDGGHMMSKAGSTFSTSRDFILSNPSQTEANYITAGAGSDMTISGIISGSSFVKLGTGTLTLTGNNTHTNGTQIQEGTLAAAKDDVFGTGFLAITGGTLQATDSFGLDRSVYIAGATGGFNVDSGKTLDVNSVIYGGGTINKTGDGVLSLNYYNSYTGGINITGGKVAGDAYSILGDITMAANTELEFDEDLTGYYESSITGDSSAKLIKKGAGTLVLEAVNTVGTAEVAEGVLIAREDLAANVNILSGAVFSSVKKTTGDINNAGKIIADTGSAGVIEGDLNVSAGGSVLVGIEDGSTTTLAVTDTAVPSGKGNITLDSASVLEINASGAFTSPSSFDIFSYDGSLTGTFVDVNVVNSKRLLASLDYGTSGLVKVIITRILSTYSQSPDLTPNQRAVASAMDRISAAPSADFERVLDTIDLFASPAEQAQALTQAGGFIYANAIHVNSFDLFRNNAYLRLNRYPESEDSYIKNIWVQAVGSYGEMKENGESADLYNTSGGFNTGLDKYNEDKNYTLGFFAGYVRNDMRHNGSENLDGDEYQLGAYFKKAGERLDLHLAGSLGYQDNYVTREMHAFARRAEGRSRNYMINLDAELGARIIEGRVVNVRLLAGINNAFIIRGSFNESGAGSMNLKFEGDQKYLAAARAGVGIEKKGRSFEYYANAIAKQLLTDYDTEFKLAGESIKIKPADRKAVFGAEAGGSKKFSEQFSVYGGGGADINGDMKNIFVNFGVRSYW